MNKWTRQIHRWASVLFVVTVLITTVAMSQPEPQIWISYTPLFPLLILSLTGIYLFGLPHVARWRSGQKSV
jgi:hypothetical protein